MTHPAAVREALAAAETRLTGETGKQMARARAAIDDLRAEARAVADGASLTLAQATTLPAGKTAQVDGSLVTNAALTVAGTMNLSANALTGSGSVAVNAGATLGVKADGGINAQVTAAGPNTFDPGASYGFNGAAAQVTGSALPASPPRLAAGSRAGRR